MLNDAKKICLGAIKDCLVVDNVKKQLLSLDIKKEVYLLAVGKAAFSMAKGASEVINIKRGIVISKYGHIEGDIDNVRCLEAGHPIMDENTLKASIEAIKLFSNLNKDDIVIFLLSGGASALFELSDLDLDELQSINDQMLKKGLNIEEINTIRKRLSKVKGGKFADICKPAKIYSLILSDVLSDRLDMIGSGPTAKDLTNKEDAFDIIKKYDLKLSKRALDLINNERSVEVDNCENIIIGSVKLLYKAALRHGEELGYKVIGLRDDFDGHCHDAADYLFENIKKHLDDKRVALIMSGETVVNVKGSGLGGRNQELVFYMSKLIKDMDNVLVMSLGSDGTDGPTDAAGGYCDGYTFYKLKEFGLDYDEVLKNNDSYHALEKIGYLIKTGPTGTNVNDITIALINN